MIILSNIEQKSNYERKKIEIENRIIPVVP